MATAQKIATAVQKIAKAEGNPFEHLLHQEMERKEQQTTSKTINKHLKELAVASKSSEHRLMDMKTSADEASFYRC